jgi:uncharacterized protein
MIAIELESLKADFVELMKRHYGERLAKVVLYGSYARGDFHEESDIDFLVVLKNEFKRTIEINKIVELVADLMLQKNKVISVQPLSLAELAKKSSWLFFKNIQKEGKILYEG